MPTKTGDLIRNGDWIKITRPSVREGGDGGVVYVRVLDVNVGAANSPNLSHFVNHSDTLTLDIFNNFVQRQVLNWHNCYSFGNGVESNRVGDVFNAMNITPGVKVSTVFEDYKEESKKYGLIYSGLHNTVSGINSLNEFIQAEKITKDINPSHGSIQKLYTRDTDLLTLCEDKVLKIMASKDALYNADGSPQLVATENVLGQAVPFVGEYGISKNPESFVSEAYRSYFTDKQRGAVMRLSRDGLTAISNHGMRDWFKDNLSTSRTNLLGENYLNQDNWDSDWDARNVAIVDGEIIIGYYNNDIHDNRFAASPNLLKNNILEIGKRYRIIVTIGIHSGLRHETSGKHRELFLYMYDAKAGTSVYKSFPNTLFDSITSTLEFTAVSTNFLISQWQINTAVGNYTPPGGTTDTIQNWIHAQRIAAGAPDGNNNGVPDGNAYPGNPNWFYGGTVPIEAIYLEEIKTEPKLIGSYDDRQDEYNLTIHNNQPKTISFREDVRGWVSFKSFFPENALSCANDYYTIKKGKIWQHHVQGSNRNTFYESYTNSSLNVILNDFSGSIKSFHTLDYEGSQSRVVGIRSITVDSIVYTGSSSHPDGKFFYMTDEEFYTLVDIAKITLEPTSIGGVKGNTSIPIKQYRNNILIWTGLVRVWNDPAGGGIAGLKIDSNGVHIGIGGDWQVGDVITTEQQEKTVNHFNSMPKDGWWVSEFTTDKDRGSLPEFIEKEGKWFNYVKGVETDIDENTNFGAFDIQGVGVIDSVVEEEMVENGNFSSSSNWVLSSGWTITNGKAVASGDAPYFYQDVNLKSDEEYIVTYTVSDYNKGAIRVVLYSDGKHGTSTVRSSNGIYTENVVISNSGGSFTNRVHFQTYGSTDDDFKISDVSVIPVKQDATFSFANNINSSLQIGDILYYEKPSEKTFGFTRLESDNIQKAGVVKSLTSNTITLDDSENIPSEQDYIFFVKNQVVNKASLKGYYADVKLENNSKRKVEIFSLGSEITESSK